MLLSARFLTDVAGVNSFEQASAAEINEGDAQDLYLQLVDASIDRSDQGFNPPGRRYMPPATSTFLLTFQNVDDAKVVTRFASQPFAQDPSIWKVSLLSSDPLSGTVTMKGVLTTPAGVLSFANVKGLLLRCQ